MIAALAALPACAAPPPPATRATATQMAAFHARGQALLQAAEPDFFALDDVKFRGYDTVATTALHGCGAPALADGMANLIDPALVAKSIDKASYAFVLPPLVRYMRLYPHCLGPQRMARISALLALPQPLFTHGTLNHALMSATSWYLLAEMLPDQQWHDGRGRPVTSAEVVARYRTLLMGRFAETLAHGQNEQLSSSYAVLDILPLFNLIDFAKDRTLADAAEVIATTAIGMLRVDSADGFVLPPLARETKDALQTGSFPKTTANDLLWLFYGPGAQPPHPPYHPTYLSIIATSRWRPPAALFALQQPADLPYTIATRTAAFSEWAASGTPQLIGSALVAADVAIGSGELVALPKDDGANAVAFAILPRRAGGADAISCTGTKDDHASTLQQAVRAGRGGALLYGTGATPSCRFGGDADETVRGPDTLLLRYGGTAIGLRVLGGTFVYTAAALPGFVQASLTGPRPALLYRAVPLPAGARLDTVRAALAGATYDPVAAAIRFRADDGGTVVARYAAPVSLGGGMMESHVASTLDGRAPAVAEDYFASPMLAVGGGRMTMRTALGTVHGTVDDGGGTLSN